MKKMRKVNRVRRKKSLIATHKVKTTLTHKRISSTELNDILHKMNKVFEYEENIKIRKSLSVDKFCQTHNLISDVIGNFKMVS